MKQRSILIKTLEMIKKGILILALMFSFQTFSQNKITNKNKINDRAIFCQTEDGKMVRLDNVIVNPSKKLIGKIQKQLNYIRYDVVETEVLDYQTKQALKSFNRNNGLKDLPYLFQETVNLLKRKYNQKKKASKTNI